MGVNRAFARKLSAPKLLKWEISSDRFQAKCNNTKANTYERTRSESCKMTSIIHVNSKQRRWRLFLQMTIVVTLVELRTDRAKLQNVCVCEGLCACFIFSMLASICKCNQTHPSAQVWFCWFPNSELSTDWSQPHWQSILSLPSSFSPYPIFALLIVFSPRAWLGFRWTWSLPSSICNILCKLYESVCPWQC